MDRRFMIERLQRMVDDIGNSAVYGGNRISASIMEKIKIEERDNGAGVLAPYWLSVTEKGRGPRKSNVDSGLVRRIYAWMEKNNMFDSTSPKGKMNEAKSMTWYINKYGNKQFRDGVFVDVYNTARESAIKDIMEEYGALTVTITKEIL